MGKKNNSTCALICCCYCCYPTNNQLMIETWKFDIYFRLEIPVIHYFNIHTIRKWFISRFFFLLFGLLWRREPFYACTRIFMGQHFLKFEMVSLFLYLKTYILISQLPISLKHHCSIIVGMLEWVWKSTGGKWYCWWYVLCLGCRCVRFA